MTKKRKVDSSKKENSDENSQNKDSFLINIGDVIGKSWNLKIEKNSTFQELKQTIAKDQDIAEHLEVSITFKHKLIKDDSQKLIEVFPAKAKKVDILVSINQCFEKEENHLKIFRDVKLSITLQFFWLNNSAIFGIGERKNYLLDLFKDTSEKTNLQKKMEQIPKECTHCALSDNRKYFAYFYKELYLIDLTDPEIENKIHISPGALTNWDFFNIQKLCFSSDSKKLFAFCNDIAIWDMETLDQYTITPCTIHYQFALIPQTPFLFILDQPNSMIYNLETQNIKKVDLIFKDQKNVLIHTIRMSVSPKKIGLAFIKSSLVNFDVESLLKGKFITLKKWDIKIDAFSFFDGLVAIIPPQSQHILIYTFTQILVQKIPLYPGRTRHLSKPSILISPDRKKIAIADFSTGVRVFWSSFYQKMTALLLARELCIDSVFYKDNFPLDLFKYILELSKF